MNTLRKISAALTLVITASIQLNAQSLKEAIKLTEGEKFPKASAAFAQLIKADPSNAQNYFYCANNYFKWGKTDSAKIIYNQGIAAAPKSAINYAGLGQVQWALNDTAEGAANMNKALLLCKSKDILVINKVADAYINYTYKKIPTAQALLAKGEKKFYKNTDLHILKGDAYLLNNQTSEAFSSYETAYDLDSTSFTVLLKLGNVMAGAQQYGKALDYLVAINIMDSTFVPAYKEKAYMCEQMKDYALAIEQLKKYLSYNENTATRTDLAFDYYLNDEFRNALQEINTIQSTDTSNIRLYRLAANSYYELASYDSCAANMQKFIERAPQDTSIRISSKDYMVYGKSLAKTVQDSMAVIYLKKALELSPNLIDLYSDLGNSYAKLKNYPEAVKYHELKILNKKEKSDVRDYNALANAFYQNKEYEKADSIYKKVIELKPEGYNGYLMRARCNDRLDPERSTGRAIPHYELVFQKADPEKNKKDIVNGLYYCGIHYIKIKEYKKAKEVYLKIIAIEPESPEANKFLNTPMIKKIKL